MADLGGAVVTKVNIVVPFAVDAESAASKLAGDAVGGVAKVVAKPDLHILEDQTQVRYTWGTKGMQPQTGATFALKKSIDIPGLIEEKKYKASESAQQDIWGTEYGAIRVFTAYDEAIEKTQAIEIDGDAYAREVEAAASAFLKANTDLFASYANK